MASGCRGRTMGGGRNDRRGETFVHFFIRTLEGPGRVGSTDDVPFSFQTITLTYVERREDGSVGWRQRTVVGGRGASDEGG